MKTASLCINTVKMHHVVETMAFFRTMRDDLFVTKIILLWRHRIVIIYYIILNRAINERLIFFRFIYPPVLYLDENFFLSSYVFLRPEFKIIHVKNIVLVMYFVYLLTRLIQSRIIVKFNIIIIIYNIVQKEFLKFTFMIFFKL